MDYSAFVRAVQPPDESVDGAGVLSFRDTARGLAGQPIREFLEIRKVVSSIKSPLCEMRSAAGAVVDTPKLARRHSTSAVASVPHIWTDTEKNSLKLRSSCMFLSPRCDYAAS